jgi:hypothetical protein
MTQINCGEDCPPTNDAHHIGQDTPDLGMVVQVPQALAREQAPEGREGIAFRVLDVAWMHETSRPGGDVSPQENLTHYKGSQR